MPIYTGDLNLPKIDWSRDYPNPASNHNQNEELLCEIILDLQPISWDTPDNAFRPRWLVPMHNRTNKIFFCASRPSASQE